MAGSGPKASALAARMPAPVGVVSSLSPPASTSAPASSSSVAGAGTGSRPCAVSTVPPPSGTRRDVMRDGRSQASAAAAPTMSTIESTAPTSWKATSSHGHAMQPRLDDGDAVEDVQRPRQRIAAQVLLQHRPNVAIVRMRVPPVARRANGAGRAPPRPHGDDARAARARRADAARELVMVMPPSVPSQRCGSSGSPAASIST